MGCFLKRYVSGDSESRLSVRGLVSGLPFVTEKNEIFTTSTSTLAPVTTVAVPAVIDIPAVQVTTESLTTSATPITTVAATTTALFPINVSNTTDNETSWCQLGGLLDKD